MPASLSCLVRERQSFPLLSLFPKIAFPRHDPGRTDERRHDCDAEHPDPDAAAVFLLPGRGGRHFLRNLFLCHLRGHFIADPRAAHQQPVSVDPIGGAGHNLIYLLQNGSDFIRNNSKVRSAKKAQYRVDKPDYADRAVTEVLVNALIHRDYIVRGSEIHIDMYDDRLEIQSPGGMFEGKPIQDCNINTVGSVRRNPVIADLFHRMKFMERRGSGLRKIISETEKLPGYTEELRPEFHSSGTDFRVVLKNVNYNLITDSQDESQVTGQVESQDDLFSILVDYCSVPRSRAEMMEQTPIKSVTYFRKAFLLPLLDAGKIKMTIPEKPNSKNQKYIKAEK